MVTAFSTKVCTLVFCALICSLVLVAVAPRVLAQDLNAVDRLLRDIPDPPEANPLPPPENWRPQEPDAASNVAPEPLDLSQRKLSEIRLDIRPGGELIPPDSFDEHSRNVAQRPYAMRTARDSADFHLYWEASGVAHFPLYFEEVALDRYGQGYGHVIQPIVSGAKFFGNVAILPYRMGLDSPTSLNYSLGHIRPGSHAPFVREHLPWNWRAAAMQAGAVVGIGTLFP